MHRALYALATGLLATALTCTAADPSLLSLVMPDAKVVSGIHVDRSKTTPFGRYVLSQMQTKDQDLRKFVDQTGFDPRRDLDEIVIASTGTPDPAHTSPVRTLIVGRGAFDVARVAVAAKQAGALTLNYHGVNILRQKEGASKDGGMALLDGGTALIGDVASIEAAIDQRQAGSAAPSALLDKVRKISAANDAWFVTLGTPAQFLNGKIADPNLNGAMQGNLLATVQEASGGIRFGESAVSLTAEVVARSEKDATALADVIRFLAGMVQLNSAPGASKGASLLENMQLSAQANVMTMSLAMPEDQLEQLLGAGRAPRKAAAVRP